MKIDEENDLMSCYYHFYYFDSKPHTKLKIKQWINNLDSFLIWNDKFELNGKFEWNDKFELNDENMLKVDLKNTEITCTNFLKVY